MRGAVFLMLVGCSVPSTMAERVFWNAEGRVTEVTGPGLQALVAADEDVAIEFSYDDGGVGIGRTGIFPFFQTFNFRQNIELAMEVRIGGRSWAGGLSSGPSGTPLMFEVTDVENPLGVVERVSPTLSSRFGDVFTSFPGASTTAANELQVSLEDGQNPYDAVVGLAFVPVTNPPAEVVMSDVFFNPCGFTFGSGEIRAGVEKVRFEIDLSTLRIGAGSPASPPVSINAAIASVGGAQVELTWEATVGKCYRIQWSSDLQNWSNLFGVLAESDHGSYIFGPVGAAGAQYYRILQLD